MGMKAKFVEGEKVFCPKEQKVGTILSSEVYVDDDGYDDEYGPIYLYYMTYDIIWEDGTKGWVFEKNLEPIYQLD